MTLEFKDEGDRFDIVLSGDFIAYDDERAKMSLYRKAESFRGTDIVVSAADLKKWDSSLVVILFEVSLIAERRKIKIDWSSLPDNLRELVQLALEVDRKPEQKKDIRLPFIEKTGVWGVAVYNGIVKGGKFIGETLTSVWHYLTGTAVMRKVDLWFSLEDSSYKAIGIVSLVSFMVGLILAFVGAIQLKMFGAQIYVASLVAVGMTRIMGAIMAGIIMAGRTGASYAATIGTMQVNEEIDALKTMGIPTTDFLVLPRILSLLVTMPILTMLADVMGIAGGAMVGVGMLDISVTEYWKYTFDALKMNNFLVGVFHGFVYGAVIALCGCYYGVNCGRNADSVGVATTKAVVTAIVWMIVVTGILTWLLQVWGI